MVDDTITLYKWILDEFTLSVRKGSVKRLEPCLRLIQADIHRQDFGEGCFHLISCFENSVLLVHLAMESLLTLERHIILRENHFLDVFTRPTQVANA